MIKKILLAVLVALPMSVAAQKFGVVSAEQIFAGMPETAEIQKKLGEASKQYEDEYAKLQEEMNKKFAEYQAHLEDANTPQSIKDRRLQEIQEMDKKAQQFLQTAQQDLQRQQQQLMQPIQEKLLNAIKIVGAEQNLVMVFPAEVPVYVSTDVVDITSLVMKAVGATAPAAPTATPAN